LFVREAAADGVVRSDGGIRCMCGSCCYVGMRGGDVLDVVYGFLSLVGFVLVG